MYHPTDRAAHTTAFVTPVVEHWLERAITQWVHPMKDRSDNPSHHERTLLPRSYISLLKNVSSASLNKTFPSFLPSFVSRPYLSVSLPLLVFKRAVQVLLVARQRLDAVLESRVLLLEERAAHLHHGEGPRPVPQVLLEVGQPASNHVT